MSSFEVGRVHDNKKGAKDLDILIYYLTMW